MKLFSWGVFVSVENMARSKFKRRRSKLMVGCKGVTGRTWGGGGDTIFGICWVGAGNLDYIISPFGMGNWELLWLMGWGVYPETIGLGGMLGLFPKLPTGAFEG